MKTMHKKNGWKINASFSIKAIQVSDDVKEKSFGKKAEGLSRGGNLRNLSMKYCLIFIRGYDIMTTINFKKAENLYGL